MSEETDQTPFHYLHFAGKRYAICQLCIYNAYTSPITSFLASYAYGLCAAWQWSTSGKNAEEQCGFLLFEYI